MNGPVELLRDGKGVFGIGVSQGGAVDVRVQDLVLRPDRLPESEAANAILQKITGGFRHGMFTHTLEERLRQVDHHERLRQAELPWPPIGDLQYWSSDKEQQIRNLQKYHGYRRASLARINALISQALDQAAVPEAVKQARRYGFRYRHQIYRAAATSQRALQLIETFPVLALSVYAGASNRDTFTSSPSWNRDRELNEEAVLLVERGAPLKLVAEAMGIPLALRKVKPGAAHLALSPWGAIALAPRLPPGRWRRRQGP